jgi:hypothetical protein
MQAYAELDSYTKLLLHFDGVNGATVFVDSAASRPVNAFGNIQINTAQYKFGGASGIFDGSGDYLTLVDSDDWYFGAGDFTIDFWVKFDSLTNLQVFAGQYVDDNNAWYIGKNTAASSNKLIFYFKNSTTRGYYVMTDPWTPNTTD